MCLCGSVSVGGAEMLYKETVTRLEPIEREESIEVPPELVKLVKGNDEKYGRNGYFYLGCNRGRHNGAVIDRLREYIRNHQEYHIHHGHPCDCPIKVS